MNPTQQRPQLVYEMLDVIQNQPDNRQRALKMREFSSFELNSILQINFRNDVRFELPPGAPPFRKDNGDPYSSYGRSRTIIEQFGDLMPANKSLSPNQKKGKFISMLEAVNEREAEVLILAKDKQLQKRWPDISREIVKAAIPSIGLR